MKKIVVLASVFALTACGLNGAEEETTETATVSDRSTDLGYEPFSSDNEADTMASNDDAQRNMAADSVASENSSERSEQTDSSKERPTMQLQVVLDRQGFGPGVIDGKMGKSTENALEGFQEANGLNITGKLDEPTKVALKEWSYIPATRLVEIPADWRDAEFTDIPEDTAAKAKLERLGYKSLDEKLAERFHTTVAVLKQLNPKDQQKEGRAGEDTNAEPAATSRAKRSDGEQPGYFQAGRQIRVPNIGADRIAKGSINDRSWQQTLASLGVGSEQPEVDRIVVSKAGQTLKAYQGEKLVAIFTVSSGSSQFPLPLGEWDIVGEAYNPPYRYDPEVLGNNDKDGEVYQLPPGPNGPVGVVWIDLSKEHYGIHGTPDPETIGRAQSSGCVRLTNWDAARLAQMVTTSTKVLFEA